MDDILLAASLWFAQACEWVEADPSEITLSLHHCQPVIICARRGIPIRVLQLPDMTTAELVFAGFADWLTAEAEKPLNC